MAEFMSKIMFIASIDGIPLRLGMMIATAMILGYVLYEGWKNLWHWLIIVGTFALVNMWFALSVHELTEVFYGSVFYNDLLLITLVVGVTAYASGLVVGAVMAAMSVNDREKGIRAAKMVYGEIRKENSH